MDEQNIEQVSQQAAQSEVVTEAAAPQAAADDNTDAEQAVQGQTVPDGEGEASGDGLTVRFNHQTRTLTREQAVQLAQKGLKYEAVAPLIQSMQQVATLRGISPAQLAQEWQAHADAAAFADAVSRCGGNEQTARLLLQNERALAQRRRSDAVTDRLAAGFLELQRAVPQVRSLDDVPQQVLEQAAESGLPLLDAYLRHRNREQQHVTAAKTAAAQAAACSIGALAGQDGSDLSPEIAAMRSAVRRR